MTQYLLHIHVGPMQTFIAAARRTRDLWFGSWLMSELSKAAARSVAEIAGENALIFPAATLPELRAGSPLAVANKIVALVEGPQKVANKAREALYARLDELAQIALDAAKGPMETRATAETQIRDLPEFYWVAVPLPAPYMYPHVHMEAENLLAARKNCRNFSQPTWGSSRPKSSLDGGRESVIPQSVSGDAQAMYRQFKAKAGEQLSGVDLLKRLGRFGDHEHFPSTSHMAAMPLRTRLENANEMTKQAWYDYMALLPNDLKREEMVADESHPVFGQADGSLLFESRLRDYYGKDVPDNIRHALKRFYYQIDVAEPIPYYAILMGDGDSMGQTINNLETPDDHRQFSQVLAGFAKQSKTIVERHQGAIVYAGGDDVLALLPLHKAIECAAELAQTFRQLMAQHKYETTFSTGIAIFHHTEPLEDGLNEARRAEREAKSVPGKDALAIVEAKRSGAPRLVKGKWGELDQRLLHVAAFYQQENLPRGLAYQLREVYLHLGGETSVTSDSNLRAIVKDEAGRLVKRKEGSEAAQKYVEDNLVGKLAQGYTMEQLVNELIIAATLTRAADQANTTLPVPGKEENNDGTMDH